MTPPSAVPGLDVTAWQVCITAPEAATRVAADVALGTSLGIDATPTFVVNGEPVVGAVPEGDPPRPHRPRPGRGHRHRDPEGRLLRRGRARHLKGPRAWASRSARMGSSPHSWSSPPTNPGTGVCPAFARDRLRGRSPSRARGFELAARTPSSRWPRHSRGRSRRCPRWSAESRRKPERARYLAGEHIGRSSGATAAGRPSSPSRGSVSFAV